MCSFEECRACNGLLARPVYGSCIRDDATTLQIQHNKHHKQHKTTSNKNKSDTQQHNSTTHQHKTQQHNKQHKHNNNTNKQNKHNNAKHNKHIIHNNNKPNIKHTTTKTTTTQTTHETTTTKQAQTHTTHRHKYKTQTYNKQTTKHKQMGINFETPFNTTSTVCQCVGSFQFCFATCSELKVNRRSLRSDMLNVGADTGRCWSGAVCSIEV